MTNLLALPKDPSKAQRIVWQQSVVTPVVQRTIPVVFMNESRIVLVYECQKKVCWEGAQLWKCKDMSKKQMQNYKSNAVAVLIYLINNISRLMVGGGS